MRPLRKTIWHQGWGMPRACPARALLLGCALWTMTLSAQAASWNKLECSAIPNSGSSSYNTTIECVAEITKTGATKWHNAPGQNCPTFCRSLRGVSVASPDGFWCTSGENRPSSAINARVDYSPTGCWHSCSQPEGTQGATSVGDRCYAPGQKRDNDQTDFTVGCFCRTDDTGTGIIDVGVSSSGIAQARAVAPARTSNWAQVTRNVANDAAGRIFNIVGDITVGNTASLTMSVNIQGRCGTTVKLQGLISEESGARVMAPTYTIALPACAAPCGDGIDNDGDGAIDALRELPPENTETISVGSVPNKPGVFDPGLVQAAVQESIRSKGLRLTLPVDNGAHITRAISSQQSPKFDDGGTIDMSTVNQVCRLLGYRTYVSSTCHDSERSSRYPNGKCSYHSPEQNGMWRFVNNDFVRENAAYHTWISSITCKDKLSACEDGWDNDGDGNVDLQDSGCASGNDNDERPHDPSCLRGDGGSEGAWAQSCVKRGNCPSQIVSRQAARLDVNTDCLINDTDAALIVNHLNSGGFYRADYDVNDSPSFLGDGAISPIDPLTIVNFNNSPCLLSTPSATPTSSATGTLISTPSATPSLTATATKTPMATLSITATATVTATTAMGSATTPSSTTTATPTVTATRTVASLTPSATGSTTATPTVTPTRTTTSAPVWPDQVSLIIFVPSTSFDPRASYDGATRGIDAANAFCRQRASAGNLVNTHSIWRALISTSSQDAQTLTGVSANSAAIINRRGEPLAPHRAALWDAGVALNHAAGYNEFGDFISVTIATGSDTRGMRQPPHFCADLTDSTTTMSASGVSSEKTRAWISKQPSVEVPCSSIHIYCVGNVQPIPSQGTPQSTPTSSPTSTARLSPSATATITPTSAPNDGSSPSVPAASPTITPSATQTSGDSGELKIETPSPTPGGFVVSSAPSKPGQLSGKIESDGKAIPGAIIYAPGIVHAALSMKDGTWVMPELQDSGANLLLKIRSTQLFNSGVDIPVSIGTTSQVKNLKVRDYNPDKCKEDDHLLNLYNAALRVRALWLASASDHKILITSKVQAAGAQDSGRALRRAHYHAQTFLELSALIPDRQLTCSSAQRTCPSISYNMIVRAMKQSATHLRHESLLFNRKLRLAGSRSEAASKQRIQNIRSSTRRLGALLQKLPISSFDCSAPQKAPARQSKQTAKRGRSRR